MSLWRWMRVRHESTNYVWHAVDLGGDSACGNDPPIDIEIKPDGYRYCIRCAARVYASGRRLVQG